MSAASSDNQIAFQTVDNRSKGPSGNDFGVSTVALTDVRPSERTQQFSSQAAQVQTSKIKPGKSVDFSPDSSS